MNHISHILCDTLKVALTGCSVQPDKFQSLSNSDWKALFDLSAKQGVLAIVYDVVSQLPREIQPPRELNIRWALCAERIEERYNTQFDDACKLAELWNKEGIRTLVLKGFSLSRYYPIPQHRECGDFAIFLESTRRVMLLQSERVQRSIVSGTSTHRFSTIEQCLKITSTL